jgi:GNAT superfamily N-acetyltransferase
MQTETHIRAVAASDHDQWRHLWSGYNVFYRAKVDDAVTERTWAKFLDPDSNMCCLVAVNGDKLIGICNYHFHQSTWSDRPYCYLEDLYVDPAACGTGAAKALILACEEQAKLRNAVRLYWHTQEYNAAARSLYDTITQRSSFIVYRKAL